MPPKKEILEKHFPGKTAREAQNAMIANFLTLFEDVSYSGRTKLQLPYEAPNHPVLPSLEEIQEAYAEWRKTKRRTLGNTFKIGECMVKSSSGATLLQEAEDLLFLQKHSQVRTPTVYSVFTHEGEDFPTHYLIMEYIAGGELTDERWANLSDKARSKFALRLSEQFQLLRSIPSEGYYGRVHRQGWLPYLSLIRSVQPGLAGPYDTYEDFVAALSSAVHLVVATRSYAEEFHHTEELPLSQLKNMLLTCNGRQPTFTHLDTAMHNIIARSFVNADGEEDWEVTLIDWADSGWCPAWVQAVSLHEKLWTGFYPNAKDDLSRQVLSTFGEDYTAQVDFFKILRDKTHYAFLK